jgi:SCO1/SenC family protein
VFATRSSGAGCKGPGNHDFNQTPCDAQGDRLKVLFLSVDAERDTPAALASYLGSFDPRITALAGSAADIACAARAFDALYEKATGSDGSYTLDHQRLPGGPGRADCRDGEPGTPEADTQKMLADLLAEH